MGGLIGSLMSGASSVIGGLFGQSNQDKAIEAQNQLAAQNWQQQQIVDKSQLQWRAADARAAESQTGLNALTLLGAPTMSYSASAGDFPSGNPVGAGIAGAGQDIGRALSAYSEKTDRHADLENKLLEAQIANVNSDTVRNSMAASKQVTQAATTPQLPPLYMKYSDGRGGVVTLPTKDASSSMQNWASIPAQIGVAAGEVGHSIEDAYHSVVSPWFKSHGSAPVRGDVRRYVAPDWSTYTPF